jgi:hypothetical protein
MKERSIVAVRIRPGRPRCGAAEHDVGESKVSLRAGAGAFAFRLRVGMRQPPRLDAISRRGREREATEYMATGNGR